MALNGRIILRGRGGGRRLAVPHKQAALGLVAIIFMQALMGCSSVEGPGTGDPTRDPTASLVWTEQAIGYNNQTLIPQSTDHRIMISGSGQDIWFQRDEFYFRYTEMSGDFRVTARLDELDYADGWTKAGLMARESLDTTSKNVLLHTTGEGGSVLQARLEVGGDTTNSAGKDPSVSPVGSWMRLTRIGTLVTGELSSDGSVWRELGHYNVPLADELYVGLAITSHAPGKLSTATFSNLRLELDYQGDTPEPQRPSDPDPVNPNPVTPSPTVPTSPTLGTWVCGSEPLLPRYSPTYYVSTTGSDSNDGRSVSNPFRTLQRAANVVQPGDVVWVRGGTYSPDLELKRSGESGRPIVFESYPGECAVLDGAGMSRPSQVRLTGVRYNTLRNFIIRNSPGQGIYLNGSHDNWITNIETYNNALSGIQNVNGDRNRFSYFISHHNYDAPDGGNNADGIGMSSGSDNVIDHCVVYNNSDDGIDTWKSYGTLVERCIAFSNGYDEGDGNGVKAGGHQEAGTTVRYSIAFDNRLEGFDYSSGSKITFEHNTAYNNRYYGFIAANSVVRNNIAYGNGRANWQDNGGTTQNSNTWNLGINDPGFISTSPLDEYFLSPRSGSPVAGRATSTPNGMDDLGALPVGETIESFLNIPFRKIMESAAN